MEHREPARYDIYHTTDDEKFYDLKKARRHQALVDLGDEVGESAEDAECLFSVEREIERRRESMEITRARLAEIDSRGPT